MLCKGSVRAATGLAGGPRRQHSACVDCDDTLAASLCLGEHPCDRDRVSARVSASAKPVAAPNPVAVPARTSTGERRRYDRSIIEGPLRPAVWKIAWPTMLTNIIGGMQGIVDHVLVGHLVGYKGNAAIGVAWQIFLIVIVVHLVAVHRDERARRAVCRRRRRGKGRPRRLSGVPHGGRDLAADHGADRLGSRRRCCSIS